MTMAASMGTFLQGSWALWRIINNTPRSINRQATTVQSFKTQLKTHFYALRFTNGFHLFTSVLLVDTSFMSLIIYLCFMKPWCLMLFTPRVIVSILAYFICVVDGLPCF